MYKLPAYGGRGYATVEAVPVDTSNAPAVRDRDEGSAEVRFQRLDAPTVDSETWLTAPNGADCRELPAATAEEACTAGELIEACSIPRSTAYRKTDLLTDAGLLEEGVRLSTDGEHASEYRCAVEEVTVSLSTSDGVEVGAGRAAPACD